ncbi:hypothetical protein [Fusobacterium necrophorum]|uniref:hypothetical protein n=1 Tax=Fusobacterium necrophorum TaxID=859 RepID=UPI00254ED305|nr:hypothetical protein [Fusobacterium necrophorum]MDK4476203.1 hypothetical protein [Fusobacterium necrophorum]
MKYIISYRETSIKSIFERSNVMRMTKCNGLWKCTIKKDNIEFYTNTMSEAIEISWKLGDIND